MKGRKNINIRKNTIISEKIQTNSHIDIDRFSYLVKGY